LVRAGCVYYRLELSLHLSLRISWGTIGSASVMPETRPPTGIDQINNSKNRPIECRAASRPVLEPEKSEKFEAATLFTSKSP
jgi:hypothetical protein